LNNQSVYSLAVSGNNIFAGTSINGIYVSTNNGTNWLQTSLNNLYVNYLVTSENNIFAGTANGVYFSANNGASWIAKNQGFNVIPSVSSLQITNNYIFAGTSFSSIWRRSLQEIIGIHSISSEVPYNFSLYQNYPNPFNPSTKIKFDIVKTGFTSLKVYDIVGKEVQVLVNEKLKPGGYETTFDGAQLTSGVYFYRLSSGEYSETKRMLLVK